MLYKQSRSQYPAKRSLFPSSQLPGYAIPSIASRYGRCPLRRHNWSRAFVPMHETVMRDITYITDGCATRRQPRRGSFASQTR